MPPLRIGLVGCGRIAQAVHIPVLSKIAGAQLVALAESDSPLRNAAARLAPHCELYSDFHELIASGSVNAVVVCLPPQLHAPCAVAAFKAGLHVYMEKPLAPSLQDAAAMLAAWRNAGTVGMMGYNFRFHPQTQAIRAQLLAGNIGKLLAVRGVFTILPHALPQWKQRRSSGGGVLLDLASHHIDLLRYVLNERFTQVFASLQSIAAEGDNAAVQLTLSSGASAQLFVSLGSIEEHRIEFLGTNGKLVMDRTELLEPQHVQATSRGARFMRIQRAVQSLNPQLLLRSPGFEPSFAIALDAFVRAATSAIFDGPDLQDGAESLAVVEAAERAALLGCVQTVSELSESLLSQ